MKGFLVLAIIAGIVACVYSSCYSSEQCGEGNCCTRATGYSEGYCKKLAEDGDRCYPGMSYDGMYKISLCPCAEGLTCTFPTKDGSLLGFGPTCRR